MRARTFLFALLFATSAVAAPVVPAPSAHAKKVPPPHATAGDIDRIAREAIAFSAPKFPKGAVVSAVRSATLPELPKSATKITIDVTAPARRSGTVSTTAVLVFWKESDVVARLPITLDLSVPPEALLFDVPKGTSMVLVVRRGLLEITAPAVSGADGDVGDVIQVLLRPSGRAFRATLIAKDRAVAVEEPR